MTSHSDSDLPLAEVLINTLLDELGDVPASLAVAGEMALLDFVGCARGGAAREARSLPTAESAESLAGALGILCSALDRDDLHLLSLTHPGSVVWPGVIALGIETEATGHELLRAAILGYEVVGRLGRALGPDHRRLWHTTGTAGTVGAATAAAHVLRLDAAATVSAVGHATSVAAGSSQCLLEGSATRLLHRAAAACNGILAARCAAAGLDATRFGFEGERGLFAATSSVDRAAEVLVAGESWVIEEVVQRYYASNGFSHAAIEAAHELAAEIRPPFASVQIELPKLALSAAASNSPVTPHEAWWSAPYAVCVTVLYGSDKLEDITLLKDDAVRRLLRRTSVSPSADDSSSVTINRRTCTKLVYRGHPQAPLSFHDLLTKCRTLDPDFNLDCETIGVSEDQRGVASTVRDLVFGATSRV